MKCFLSPSLAIDTEELLFIHDELGNTPLHWADTVEQAKILLNAASPGKQDVLICEKNLEDKTVLFITACEFGRCPEVAKYLLSLDVDKDRLLFMTERGNATALNAVMGSDVAELLVLSVSKPRRREFVYNMNIFKQSALHSAAGRGDISVIKYLLGLDFVCDDLILARDKHGLTAMQWSETVEIMEAIVSRISQENFTKLLTEPSDYGHSPLHTACYRGKTDCVKYLLSYAVTHANLLDEVDEEGNTALHSAIKQGLTEMVEAILEFFAGDFDMIETLLQQTNSDGQNVFHLAMSDLKFAEFSKTLKEYQDMIDIAKVAKPDTKGNTLFHYAVGMFNLPQFAEQIMRLSLPDRIQVLLHTFNKRMKSVFAIGKAAHYEDVNRYFVEVVLGSDLDLDFMGAWLMLEGAEGVSRSGKVELTIDPRIMKLMMYAINQYPLNDIGVLKSMNQAWLFIDDSRLNSTEECETVVKQIASMRRPDDKPKVIIRRKVDAKIKLVPPGEDFIIVNVVHNNDISLAKNWPNELHFTANIRGAIDMLRQEHNTTNVTVDSTLARHLGGPTSVRTYLGPATESNKILITGSREHRGQALIICNKKGRPDSEFQYNNAVFVVDKLLGLNVTSIENRKSAQILREVSKFAAREDHGQMVALIIMSHGDERGNIRGTDRSTVPLSVQSVIDVLCVDHLKDKPKMVILSFCRGEIEPAYNLSLEGFPSKEMVDLVNSSEYAPAQRGLPDNLLTEKNKGHSFPEVEIPPDCFVCYTTLPNSKSPRKNIMFREMKNYLQDLLTVTKLGNQPASSDHSSGADGAYPMANAREYNSEGGGLGKPSAGLLAITCEPYVKIPRPHVELVTLYQDVAGLTREKSQFKVYTNHCYTLNRHSRYVVFDILLPE